MRQSNDGSRARPEPRRGGRRLDSVRRALLDEGLSERTIRIYLHHLRAADWWCAQHGVSLTNVSAELLGEFVAVRPRTHATRRHLRTALKHYWRITGRRNPPLWVIHVPRKPRPRCRALSEADAALLERAARNAGGAMGAATLLGLYLGLRREEIASLRWDQLDDRGWVNIVGKGGVSASLPVHPVVRHALAQLPRSGPYVFPGEGSRAGSYASPVTVWLWVRRLSDEAGLLPVNPHQLRHTCLATANEATRDLRAVQEYARHARPETTAIYTRVSTKRLLAVMNSLSYDASA